MSRPAGTASVIPAYISLVIPAGTSFVIRPRVALVIPAGVRAGGRDLSQPGNPSVTLRLKDSRPPEPPPFGDDTDESSGGYRFRHLGVHFPCHPGRHFLRHPAAGSPRHPGGCEGGGPGSQPVT